MQISPHVLFPTQGPLDTAGEKLGALIEDVRIQGIEYNSKDAFGQQGTGS